MYKIYGSVTSRAFRILWALEEVGAKYQFILAKPRSEAVTSIYPAGKVPVMEMDGQIITDSTAMMTYIADKHGALTYPAGTIERAQQDAVMHAILDEIDAVLWTAARYSFILPEEERMPAIKDPLKREYERSIGRLADRFQGPFLMGEMMTVPDILLTHCCNWAVSAKFPKPPEQLVPYLSAMRDRPAFKAVHALAE
ncbi:MAG: glutathione S-transferase family protein [Marinovum sp.]|nr:glutathione S-transferase family protein [Marinovum sp.]